MYDDDDDLNRIPPAANGVCIEYSDRGYPNKF